MPKRTAKQIRLDAIAEAKASGRLNVPVRVLKKKQDEKPYCCLDRHGENLPRWFKPCYDCPKNNGQPEPAVA